MAVVGSRLTHCSGNTARVTNSSRTQRPRFPWRAVIPSDCPAPFASLPPSIPRWREQRRVVYVPPPACTPTSRRVPLAHWRVAMSHRRVGITGPAVQHVSSSSRVSSTSRFDAPGDHLRSLSNSSHHLEPPHDRRRQPSRRPFAAIDRPIAASAARRRRVRCAARDKRLPRQWQRSSRRRRRSRRYGRTIIQSRREVAQTRRAMPRSRNAVD
jgi:hypothetical protein